MSLHALKRTIARVDIDGRPSGTAFLIGRKQVATALHVLANRTQVSLEFVEWPPGNRRRHATRTWRHLAGYDVAILELDKECPADVHPVPWAATKPVEGDRWSSFGFPTQAGSEVPSTDGHALVDQVIADPELRINAWDLAILQLHTTSAKYDLGGFSGAPCAIDGAIVGILTHQLRRIPPGGNEAAGREPSLDTLYALPIALLASSGVSPPLSDQHETAADLDKLVRLVKELVGESKASALAAMLRAIDRAALLRINEPIPVRAEVARRLGAALRLVVHVLWRRNNQRATNLAQDVYVRLTRSKASNITPGLRIPIFLHDEPTFLSDAEPRPVDPAKIEHSVVVVLVDDDMVVDDAWTACLRRIANMLKLDAAGISLLPIDLGSPKIVAPFQTMKLIALGDGAPSRLLIALELHLLRVLAGRRSEGGDRKHARLFLSYARSSGGDLVRAVHDLANRTAGLEAVLDDAVLAPGDPFANLESMVEGRVLVAFVTPDYGDRTWCVREFLAAKRSGAPIIMVNAQAANAARMNPYFGNVPWLKAPEVSAAADILEAATFAQLADRLIRLHLEDQRLLDDTLRHAHIVTRPPELLDLVDGPLAHLSEPVILHPDPPLSAPERQVLRSARNTRVVSPGQALAEAQPLRVRDVSLAIGLSASQPDLMPAGVKPLHFEDIWLDLIRMLVLGGATLAFGGDLREKDGLTIQLFDVVAQRTDFDRTDPLARDPALHSFLAWPLSSALDHERQARLADRVRFYCVSPPRSSVTTYRNEFEPADTVEARYRWARSLTRMRTTVLEHIRTLIVVGGVCTGSKGRYAGVVEEAVLAIRRRTPVFILGGMGGAAAAVGEALLGRAPERLTSTFQLRSEFERSFVAHYNETITRDFEADDRSPIDHDAVVEFLHEQGLDGLNNGLSAEENRLLLSSSSMPELTPVLLKGLRSLLPG